MITGVIAIVKHFEIVHFNQMLIYSSAAFQLPGLMHLLYFDEYIRVSQQVLQDQIALSMA